MKARIICTILILACCLLTACSSVTGTSEGTDPAGAPSASAQDLITSETPDSTPAVSAEASLPDNVLDPVSLLIGSWMNDELQLEMRFTSDGYYTAINNGTSLGTTAYTAEEKSGSSVTLKMDDISLDVVFTDENHLQCDGISYVRIFEDEMVNSEAALKRLLVGSWETADGCTSICDADGTLTVKQPGKEDRICTYTIEGVDETSMTVTITDADGTSNAQYTYFTDNDTMVMGEAVFTRVS